MVFRMFERPPTSKKKFRKNICYRYGFSGAYLGRVFRVQTPPHPQIGLGKIENCVYLFCIVPRSIAESLENPSIFAAKLRKMHF